VYLRKSDRELIRHDLQCANVQLLFFIVPDVDRLFSSFVWIGCIDMDSYHSNPYHRLVESCQLECSVLFNNFVGESLAYGMFIDSADMMFRNDNRPVMTSHGCVDEMN
jgi:hypothetical protein